MIDARQAGLVAIDSSTSIKPGTAHLKGDLLSFYDIDNIVETLFNGSIKGSTGHTLSSMSAGMALFAMDTWSVRK